MTAIHMDDLILPELIYRPLRRDRQEIRLLELQPAADQKQALRCALRHKPLDSAKYVALSYVWGDQTYNRSGIEIKYKDGELTPALNASIQRIFHPKARRDLRSNMYRRSIGSSLAAALRHLRQRTTPVTIWADALCINQDDDEEKSWQIRLMTRIYSKAMLVRAWLGPCYDENPEIVDAVNVSFDFIHLVGKLLENSNGMGHLAQDSSWFRTCFAVAQSRTCDSPQDADKIDPFWVSFLMRLRDMLISKGLGRKYLPALKVLSQIRWFSRIWILQESGRARTLTFHYGERRAAYELCFLSLCLARGFSNSKNFLHLRTLSAGFDSRFLNCLTARMPVALTARKPVTLSEVLQLAYLSRSRHEATDPRDLIYGLLGLVDGRVEIKIDYSLSVEEVYVTTSRLLLLQGFTGPLIAFKPYTPSPDLPSWAYDWSTKGLSSFDKFAACGRTTHQLSFVQFPGSKFNLAMTLKGSRLGHITIVGNRFYFQAKEAGFSEDVALSGVMRDNQGPFSAEEKRLLKSAIIREHQRLRLNVADADVEKLFALSTIPLASFWLWWIKWVSSLWTFVSRNTNPQHADRISKNVLELLLRNEDSSGGASYPISGRVPVIQSLQQLIGLRSLLEAAPNSSQGLTRQFETLPGIGAVKSLFRSAWGMMPIALDAEHVGYAPEGVKLHDEVVVFYGVKAPLVIRRVDEKSHRIIGPAHVCGVMQGEFLNTKPLDQIYVLV